MKKFLIFFLSFYSLLFNGCFLFDEDCTPEYRYLVDIPAWITEISTSDIFENTNEISNTFKISDNTAYSVPVGEKSRIVLQSDLKSFRVVPENTTLYKPVVEKIYLGTVYGGEPKLHITENNGVYEFDCNNADEVKRINSNMSSENSFFQHKICHIKFEKVDDGYNFYLTPHGQNGLVLGPFHFTKAD